MIPHILRYLNTLFILPLANNMREIRVIIGFYVVIYRKNRLFIKIIDEY